MMQPEIRSQSDAERRPDAVAGGGEDPGPVQPDQDAADSAAGATSGIPVVGLGGSAGALQSFRRFLAAMPAESGAAFVIIQHLAPAHESLLPELLAQHTRMRVVPAQDAVPVEANCVYVMPPRTYLSIREGVLSLAEPIPSGRIPMPIDFFFRALAEDRQERAVGILFSGAGSDGTLGVRAIRGAGGLTIAQDPGSAQFGDMPRSAIATGLVDYVLPADRMAEVLLEYLRQPYVRAGEPAAVLAADGRQGGLQDVLAVVLAETGCDFRCYKKSTILRRIERRMGLHHVADLAQYYDLLRRDANEVAQLLKDLLINVTAFFRDARAFEELQRQAIAPLIQAKLPEEPVRAWVVGCASGEEAHALAMLLTEEVAAAGKRSAVQVFATDIDEEALRSARVGTYPESLVADVGDARVARFFVRKDHGYQVDESLRKSVVFAAHNVITDPPFSKMDLISCRNLLIYLDAETQTKLMSLFSFALNPGGYLFLGKSEGIGGQTGLFAAASKQARLYRRLTPAHAIVMESPILPGRKRTMPDAGSVAGRPPATAFGEMIRQALLQHFSASIVLVNRYGHILQFHGQTGKYLNMPTAEPTLNLFDIAKEALSARIRVAVHTAGDSGKTVVFDGLPITREDGAPCVRVTIAPSVQQGDPEPLLAVIFEDVPRPVAAGGAVVLGESESVVRQFESELRATRMDLQGTIAELRAANEEVMSGNEELQSTNEELETSKEELQSVNEELITVNSQLQEKIERLDTANSDLANLLASTQIATLFLDGELRVRFFTPASTPLLKLLPSDTGRPISDLSTEFLDFDLAGDARAVARDSAVVEREVQRADGSFYLVRILPYRTPKAQSAGVVVTFSNVTRLRHAEQQTRRLATVVRDSNDAVILCDTTGNILAWNHGAEGMYGWSETEALRMRLRDVTPPDRSGETADLVPRLLAGQLVASFESRRRTKDGRVLDVWVTATAILNESTQAVEGLATTERDITEHKQAEAALREAYDELERRVQERTAALSAANHALTTQAEQIRSLASELTLAEQRERVRLAEQIHDGLQQLLVAARLGLTLLGRAEDSTVRQSCQDVGQLLGEALVLARSLTAELSPPVLRTGGLLAGLEWLTRWSQEKHHFTVQVTAPATPLPPLPEDLAILLFRAIRELLFNAVKYAQVREAAVTLTWDAPGLTLTVADAGVGFDPGGLRGEGGTGGRFGLATIRHRIELLGGCMTITSAPGQGTRVTLAFLLPPTDQPAAPPTLPLPTAAPQPTLALHSGSPRTLRVLLVDDHQVVRQALAQLLGAESDLEVVGQAGTGTAAVALARQLAPDVVLMDINMPEMNGIEATRAIHAEFPRMRVIGLSMFDRGDQQAAMQAAGAVAYVSKTGPAEGLLAAIRGRG